MIANPLSETWEESLSKLKSADNSPAMTRFKEMLAVKGDPVSTARQLYDYLDQWESDLVENQIEEILGSIAEQPELTLDLIILVLERGQLGEKLNWVLQLLERLPEGNGIQVLDNAIIDLWLYPGEAASHYNMGYAWTLLDKFDLAMAAYNRALEMDPNLVNAYN